LPSLGVGGGEVRDASSRAEAVLSVIPECDLKITVDAEVRRSVGGVEKSVKAN